MDGAGWALSAALHGGVFALLASGIVPSAGRTFAAAHMSFEVVGSKLGPVPPASPVLRGSPPPRSVPQVAKAAPRAPTPAPPESPRPNPAETQPVDLTGVTLTGQGDGASWSSVVGNGARMNGAIQVGTRDSRPPPAVASAGPPPAPRVSSQGHEPRVLPLLDLSRRPVPPRLDGVLKSYYPADARRGGVSGRAVVRARIDAEGRVSAVTLLTESWPGFGEACRKTVLGSSWSPPLDAGGRAVATEVSYTCRFEVER
jgi:TonB family protein